MTHGEVMSLVKVTLNGGYTVTAAATREAAEELSLTNGSSVSFLLKATEVMLAVDD